MPPAARSSRSGGKTCPGCRSTRSTRSTRTTVRRRSPNSSTPLAAARVQHHVRTELRGGLSRLLEPRRPSRRGPRPPRAPRRHVAVLLAGPARQAAGVQAADGLELPVGVDVRERLCFRLPARVHEETAVEHRGGPDDAEGAARLARGLGSAGRHRSRVGDVGEPDLDRLRARGRRRLPHLHPLGARSRPRRAVLQPAARHDAEGAGGRVPGHPPRRVRGRVTALAVRSRTTILFAGAATAAWAVSIERMRDMDAGPGMGLGGLDWYLGVWVAMSAAMMLPTAAHAARLARVVRAIPASLFAAGYLAVWIAFGVAAYALLRDELATNVVAAVVVAAAIYEVTPLKRRSLRRCRSQEASTTAFRSGLRHGVDCVGCSGGLMVVLLVLA